MTLGGEPKTTNWALHLLNWKGKGNPEDQIKLLQLNGTKAVEHCPIEQVAEKHTSLEMLEPFVPRKWTPKTKEKTAVQNLRSKGLIVV